VAGVIIVFDLNSMDGLNAVERWRNNTKINIEKYSQEKIPMLLLGNKNDLMTETNPGVTDQMIEEYLNNESGKSFFRWFRVSAKSNENVGNAMEALSNEIYKTCGNEYEIEQTSLRSQSVNKKSGCCS